MQVGQGADTIDREIMMSDLAHRREAFVEDATAPNGTARWPGRRLCDAR
jgi:hypothetical protein